MIKYFKDVMDSDFTLVGGKGYNLSKMYQANIHIPNGFILLSTVYDSYIAHNNLAPEINKQLNSHQSSEDISQSIKSLFNTGNMSDILKNSLSEAFKSFKSGRVAVRSSSTVEDLPGMSFAGQYSTYLNVSENELYEKIINCWQSLWNTRAIEYRKKNNVTTDFSHAVVIQEMVNATLSGVAFTANPLTGMRNELVINASYGLGEAIVSGEVNPDQYVIDKSNGTLIHKIINKKEVKYHYTPTGIDLIHVPESETTKDSLDANHISKLLEACKKIETYFGKPQDIEFAFDLDNHLYIVQSRDITTLFPIDLLDHDDKLRAYLGAGTVLFGMKEPFTPLGFDIMSNMFPTIINIMTARKKKPLTNNFVKYAGNRMYVDMTYLLANKFVSKQFANAFSGNDLPLKGVMYRLIEHYGRTFKKQGIHFKLPLGFVKYGISLSGKMRSISKIPDEQRYAAMREVGNTAYAIAKQASKEAKTIEERLNYAKQVLVDAFKLSQLQSLYCLNVNNLPKIEKSLKKYFGDKYKSEILLQSLPGCFTQTMMVQLNNYAKYCDENGVKPEANDPVFGEILETYGHRANIELDFGTRRWREDPSYLLSLVETYMTNQMYKRNLEDHIKKRIEAEEMIEEIYETLSVQVSEKKALKLKNLMTNYRYGAAMREYPKSDIVRFLELGRNIVKTIGEEFVLDGKLNEVEDIFFLHKTDILKGKNLKEIVHTNRENYTKEMKRTTIPRILLNNGATYYTSTVLDPHSDVLQGMALSPGIYEGHIKVVFDPLNANLKEGEIMVTESTNPAWTPLFATASGLIMEYGGPMSHGGIVAREYGIPAVVGIPSATAVLKDGQKVRINGEMGTIELLND